MAQSTINNLQYIKITDLPSNYSIPNCQMTQSGKCHECRAYLSSGTFETPYGILIADSICNCQKWRSEYQNYISQFKDDDDYRNYQNNSPRSNNSGIDFNEDF